MLKTHVISLLALLAAAPLGAVTYRVPLDQPDVAAALAVAQDGDTVAVAASFVVPGGLVVPGRDLALLGGWDDAFTAVVGRTAVAGTAATAAVQLAPPVTGSPLLAGFDITGGGGAARTAPVAGRYGGGLLVEGGSPMLRDLSIVGAEAGTLAEFGAGGGLALLDSEAAVENVTVSGCRAVWGGGIYVNGGAPAIRDAVIADNTCRAAGGPEEARGAGVAVHLGDLVIETTEIRGGRGAVRGGGLSWLGTRGRVLEVRDCEIADNEMDLDGAGLYAEGGAVTLTGGRFLANVPSPDAPYTSGGGAYLTGARATIDGVTFAANRADAGGGVTVNTAPQADVRDAVFLANEATLFGAALNYQSNDAGEIRGNTVAGNVGAPDQGVVNVVNSSPDLALNLVAHNTGGGLALAGGALAPTCNDVFGNTGAAWSGLADPTGQNGNFAVDPLFCDLAGGDVTLAADSPCLDAAGCGLVGALGEGCGGEVDVADLAAVGLAVSAYPNPFNPAVTLRARLEIGGAVRLTVHDLRGRLVRVLAEGDRPAGWFEARWNGRDDTGRGVGSGVYVYRITTANGVGSGRLTLVP